MQIRMKMLDAFQLFEDNTTDWMKTLQNFQSTGRPNAVCSSVLKRTQHSMLSLVMTTLISRPSSKI